ncbi:PREDICTED: 39S ribosomal protein L32, mitochondrial-like [Amphimedon queenslandica]|nr:PREDICTED: 39S ribosomal protein L32, mitochondrial-like [Amphimedon queenslandica]|eukprot:XP_011402555.1 PREDICTED: 39S ribosomal protein L32, mitochondrial-like [Amphimedon queenslandica]
MSNFVHQIVKKTSNRIGFPLGQLCALISGPKLPPRTPALATVCTPTAPRSSGDTSWGFTGEDGFLSSILWAVPKKRVSRHKKRLRMQSKWLRPIQNYMPCPKCGNPKLLHVLCGTCFRRTMRKTAEYRKKNVGTLYSKFKKGVGF